jgi:hypothetical protein
VTLNTLLSGVAAVAELLAVAVAEQAATVLEQSATWKPARLSLLALMASVVLGPAPPMELLAAHLNLEMLFVWAVQVGVAKVLHSLLLAVLAVGVLAFLLIPQLWLAPEQWGRDLMAAQGWTLRTIRAVVAAALQR